MIYAFAMLCALLVIQLFIPFPQASLIRTGIHAILGQCPPRERLCPQTGRLAHSGRKAAAAVLLTRLAGRNDALMKPVDDRDTIRAGRMNESGAGTAPSARVATPRRPLQPGRPSPPTFTRS